MTKIFLDAGHGGKDVGAIGNGLQEKNIVLAITSRIAELLKQYKNVEVMQTRTNDVFLSLSERTNKANSWGADAFVSVHINSAIDATARGFETYVYPNANASTISFQNVMHQEIISHIREFLGFRDRGKKRANFHVLRETNMKAVLTENLFISNSADATLLKSSMYLDSVALGHAQGLEKFFGLERIRPPSTDEPNKTLFQVVAGSFSEYENAQKRVEALKNSGYDSFIQEK